MLSMATDNLAATSSSVAAQIKDPTWLRRHDAKVRADALREAAEHSIVVVDAGERIPIRRCRKGVASCRGRVDRDA
jgi:hypothetical protein